ncbi:MAG: hypothetical protein DRH76_10140, partial [Deltaproteobacteria bacterium]
MGCFTSTIQIFRHTSTVRTDKWGVVLSLQCGTFYIPPVFIGPDVSDLYLEELVAMSEDYSALFDLAPTSYAMVGTMPDGIAIDASGVLSGLPTPVGRYDPVQIKAMTDAVPFALSNLYAIIVYQTAQRMM